MKNYLFLSLFILLIILINKSFGQNCEQCKSRRVIIYDNVVNAVPEDSTPTGIINYWKLYWIASGVRGYIQNSDASRDCFHLLDGTFFTTNDSVPQSGIKFGIAYANVPPAGAVKWANADYLIYGIVSGSNGTYNVTLNLEAAQTREIAKTGTITYTFSEEPLDAGKALAAQIAPLYQSIMDFEKKKRDEGEPYAIYPKVEMTPDKESLSVGESTNIEVKLIDCDDVPLKGRKIDFAVSDGSLDNESAVTDDNGMAIIIYTAGSKAGLAEISSIFIYEHPSGGQTSGGKSLYIPVDKPNSSWFAKGDYTRDVTTSNIAKLKDVGYNKKDDNLHETTHFGAYVNVTFYTETNFESEPKPISFFYTGDYTRHYFEHGQGWGECWHSDSQSTNEIYAQSEPASNPVVDISKGDGFGVLLDGIYGHETATYQTVNTYISCYEEDKNTDEDTFESEYPFRFEVYTQYAKDTSVYNNSTIEEEGKTTITSSSIHQTFKSTNKSVSFSYRSNGTRDITYSGNANEDHEKITISLNFSMTNQGTIAINEHNYMLNYPLLEQNYPNPVKGLSVVGYQLSEKSNVLLKVYDLLGNEIMILVNSSQEKGIHKAVIDATELVDGIYYYNLKAGDFSATKKIIVLK